MTTEHPITPPPELVASLRNSAPHGIGDSGVTREIWLINHAYAAGADAELEACCLWLSGHIGVGTADILCEARRRPKPSSLTEQALARTNAILNDPHRVLLLEVRETLKLNRRALEALPND